MNALVVVGAAILTVLTKGARMPSTAEEVRAETSSPSLRATADFRYTLDFLSDMHVRVRRRCTD